MPRSFKISRSICLASLFFLISCVCLSASEQTTPLEVELEQLLPGKKLAIMQTNDLVELSGMTASAHSPGLLWGHNDSGDKARVFLFDPNDGTIKLEARLQGIRNIDYEDMTAYHTDDGNYLVLADIGDNAAKRSSVQIHRFKEPTITDTTPINISKDQIETMELVYAEGARDAETIMSSNDGKLIVITKRENKNHIYAFDFKAGQTLTVNSLGKIAIKNITAGDIRNDGAIALRSYDTIYFWPPSEESIIARLKKGPTRKLETLSEPQGEALTWDHLGGLYSIPEKVFFHDQNIHYYPGR